MDLFEPKGLESRENMSQKPSLDLHVSKIVESVLRTRTYQVACVALVAPKSDVLDTPWGTPIVSARLAQVNWRSGYAIEEKRSTYGQAFETISWFSSINGLESLSIPRSQLQEQ